MVTHEEEIGGYSGMTLRDWFAGQALTGIMANRFQAMTPPDIAKTALAAADAMLAARAADPK